MKGSMEKGGMAIKGKILKVVPIILVLAIVFGCAVDELETNVPESPDARVAVATQEEIASHSPEEQTAEKQTAEKKSPENEEHQPSLERSSFRHIQSPGYAELIDVSDGVAGWTSRDIVIKVVDVTNHCSSAPWHY